MPALQLVTLTLQVNVPVGHTQVFIRNLGLLNIIYSIDNKTLFTLSQLISVTMTSTFHYHHPLSLSLINIVPHPELKVSLQQSYPSAAPLPHPQAGHGLQSLVTATMCLHRIQLPYILNFSFIS